MVEAERRKALALLRAAEEAEAAALRARSAAESDRATSADWAEAERVAADAIKHLRLAEAEAARARIEAENARSDAIVAMELEMARLGALPRIVAEMVKPAEKIRSINIHQIGGLPGASGGGGGERAPVAQAMDQILNMAVRLPALKKIGEAVGMDIDESLTSLTDPKRKT